MNHIGTYLIDDVVFLLDEIHINDTNILEKEQLIQSNKKHYSELISKEYLPTQKYMDIFYKTIQLNKIKVAKNVVQISNHINQSYQKPILVSLARAGTPIGVLIKRTLKSKFKIDASHYTISIIRDRGIDINALNYILEIESKRLNISKLEVSKNILFIDGWTGKGVIKRELDFYIQQFNHINNVQISSDLCVLVDICGKANISATFEDYLIPSAALNSTISGLISRTILTDDIIHNNGFHGCKFYRDFIPYDLSLWYIDTIMKEIKELDIKEYKTVNIDMKNQEYLNSLSDKLIHTIQKEFNISNINYIKPGIGETTRVLLRRVPDLILVKNKDNEEIKHILELSKDKNVNIVEDNNLLFKCVGIIKEL